MHAARSNRISFLRESNSSFLTRITCQAREVLLLGQHLRATFRTEMRDNAPVQFTLGRHT